jgi:hypothetical protein
MGAYEWQGIVSARSTSLGALKGSYAPKKEKQ